MLKQIKFTASGANSAVGGFMPGDTARIDAAMAAHLVDEAKVAVYVNADIKPTKEDTVKTDTKSAIKQKKK